MADFCKQCSIELFGEDYGDMAGITTRPGVCARVLCEDCGMTLVDHTGTCVSAYCLKKHGVPQNG